MRTAQKIGKDQKEKLIYYVLIINFVIKSGNRHKNYQDMAEMGKWHSLTSFQNSSDLQKQAESNFGASPCFGSHKLDKGTKNSKVSRNHQLGNSIMII